MFLVYLVIGALQMFFDDDDDNNNFKLIQHHCHYDLRKFNFTNRVIPIWNSLSNHVVSASTINTFKDRLDKFWSNQDVLYDYPADLHGIGNRSIS